MLAIAVVLTGTIYFFGMAKKIIVWLPANMPTHACTRDVDQTVFCDSFPTEM